MYTCEDKVAFITGALGAVGTAYTKHLLQNNVKGIALVDIKKLNVEYQQELETKYGQNKCIFIEVDVGNKTDLKGAFETTVQHFGQLDIVINNAGIAEEDDYELSLNTNFMAVLHGTMMAMREYLPKYKKGPGVIVNTSSMLGVLPAAPVSVYSLSKHAIAAIGVCYANHPDCLEQNIRVLTICPGPTVSGMYSHEYHHILMGFIFGLCITEPNTVVPIAESADYLGEGLIQMLNDGINGSVWMFQDGKEHCKVNYQTNQDSALDYLLN